jgi:hypothetical protein
VYSLNRLKDFPPSLKEKKKYVDGKVLQPTKKEKELREYSMKRRKQYEDAIAKSLNTIDIITTRQREKNV